MTNFAFARLESSVIRQSVVFYTATVQCRENTTLIYMYSTVYIVRLALYSVVQDT